MLIETGIASVEIKALAARLGVTRGGFYWRFRDRQDLLDQLLKHWANRNTRPFLLAAERAGTPKERYLRLVRLWLAEKDFDPALDTAVRQWAVTDEAVAAQMREADEARIAAFARIFEAAGEDSLDAMVRARIVYFHQVGYYALGLKETPEDRRKLAPVYNRLLTRFFDD